MPLTFAVSAPNGHVRRRLANGKGVTYKVVVVCVLLSLIAISQARAGDSDFVARPKGWMILLPPLSRPDHITGEQNILTSAPDRQWSAIVVRGYDGGSYDFSDEHGCKLTMSVLAIKLYNDTSEAASRELHLLASAKCVRDDGRRHVLAQ